jgi:hypothetical protein
MGGSNASKAASRLKYRLGALLGRPRREDFLKGLPADSIGAEVGVFRGEYTEKILRLVRPRRLHLIDAWWTLYGERYPDWGAYTDFGRLTTRDAFAEVESVARRWDRGNVCRFHVGDSVAVLETFSDHYLDWVYLDTSHGYEQSVRELEVLQRKVKPAGVIAGDDWHDDPGHAHHGLARAVREYCDRYGWTIEDIDRFAQWRIARSDARR